MLQIFVYNWVSIDGRLPLPSFIGDTNDSAESSYNRGYQIYLHEKGQLWPSVKNVLTGQSKPMFLPVETELEGSFTVTEKTRLSQELAPCKEDQN